MIVRALCIVMALSASAVAQSPSPAPAAAPMFKPVIVVNDDIITDYDIDQKVRMMALSSSQPVSKKLQAAAVRELIDSNLKVQAAERLDITVDEDDMTKAVQTIAQQNNQDMNALEADLARSGITLETLKNQLESEIVWNRLVQQKFGARVRPSDEDMRREMDALRRQNMAVYELAQVLVPLEPTAPEPAVKTAYEEAQKIQQGINSGCASVDNFKGQYEKAGRLPSAMPAQALPLPIQNALANLDDNVPSDPVRSEEGFHVIVVCGRSQNTDINIPEEQVRQQVLANGFQRFAESYLQDLRRDAIVEQR